MFFRKREYPRLRIRMLKKEEGQISWLIGLFMILFLGILLCTQLQMEVYRMSSVYLEDALVASNLASAIIDVEEYGISHKLVINDFEQAYERYLIALQGNLNLNEQWESANKALITDWVTVESYIVYNVVEDMVQVYGIDAGGSMWEETSVLGQAMAPNGQVIESTSVYSEISYHTRGMWGMEILAHKGKLVDVVRLENG